MPGQGDAPSIGIAYIMPMKVIVTGASGMVGKGVLLECLDHETVSQVISIGRTKLDMDHPKLKQIAHPDFSDFSGIKEALQG